ncbi:hypothetical protein NL676_009987 [Syzygium grande]|nr:hypothetical protein NL676_009987 [Syzygium grande]
MGSKGESSRPCLAYACLARAIVASCACRSSSRALDLATDEPGHKRHVFVGGVAASHRKDQVSGSAMATATGEVVTLAEIWKSEVMVTGRVLGTE